VNQRVSNNGRRRPIAHGVNTEQLAESLAEQPRREQGVSGHQVTEQIPERDAARGQCACRAAFAQRADISAFVVQ
jgi:hypothetical protein